MSVSNQDLERINHLISCGNAENAVKMIRNLESKFPKDQNLSFNKGGFLIDCGSILKDIELIQEGINIYKIFLEKKQHVDHALFNIANGYYALGKINPKPITDENFQEAKRYYREALEKTEGDEDLLTRIWTNLGNCYDNIGRTVEAIECYENTLKTNPEHPMALGNKGIAFYWFSGMLQEHQGTFLVESYNLLKTALRMEVDADAKRHFKIFAEAIKVAIEDKSLLEDPPQFPPFELNYDSEIHEAYVEFCRNYLLYLNPCIFCQKCKACVGDPVFISMNTRVENSESFYKLTSYLNQLKQEYTSARYLFFESQYKSKDLTVIDKDVVIVDTLDYSNHDIYTELLKFSFRISVNLLDKIAFFLNDYLKLGIPDYKISFYGNSNIWEFNDKMSTELVKRDNPSLMALYDIYLDFVNKNYEEIRDLRNKSTHRYLVVQDAVLGGSMSNDLSYIKYDDFFDIVLTSMKLSRSAIIYLINFVNYEETKGN